MSTKTRTKTRYQTSRGQNSNSSSFSFSFSNVKLSNEVKAKPNELMIWVVCYLAQLRNEDRLRVKVGSLIKCALPPDDSKRHFIANDLDFDFLNDFLIERIV